MKIVMIEDNSDTKRRYTHWQPMIEEFYKSKREIWKIENFCAEKKMWHSICCAIRASVKSLGHPITVVKRGNNLYLIKVIKVEKVDF